MEEESPDKNDHDEVPPPPAEEDPRLRPESAYEELKKLSSEIPPETKEEGDRAQYDSTPIVRMVNAIITTAIEQRASDARIEPWSQSLSVRCRIDGILQEIMRLPRHLHIATINRLKLMADIPFWYKAPQTGFIPVLHNKKRFTIVVTTVPTPHGDALNMHILDTEMPHRVVNALKEEPETEAALKQALYYGGLTLIAGTAGVGKTTTAYALMDRANWVGHVAATLETEQTYRVIGLIQTYRKPGVSAYQIANGLPDQEAKVVFCGDLIDTDMAEASVKLVEAGSTVIACVTAPHAAAAVLHLLNLGIAPARLAASLSGVLMQALVGLICPDCRTSVPLGADEVKRLDRLHVKTSSPIPDKPLPESLARGEGCETCHKRGTENRIGIFDYLPLDDVTRRLLRNDDAASRLAGSPFAFASAQALHEAARIAVLEKRISLHEAERVIYPLASAAQRML